MRFLLSALGRSWLCYLRQNDFAQVKSANQTEGDCGEVPGGGFEPGASSWAPERPAATDGNLTEWGGGPGPTVLIPSSSETPRGWDGFPAHEELQSELSA